MDFQNLVFSIIVKQQDMMRSQMRPLFYHVTCILTEGSLRSLKSLKSSSRPWSSAVDKREEEDEDDEDISDRGRLVKNNKDKKTTGKNKPSKKGRIK